MRFDDRQPKKSTPYWVIVGAVALFVGTGYAIAPPPHPAPVEHKASVTLPSEPTAAVAKRIENFAPTRLSDDQPEPDPSINSIGLLSP